MCLCVKKAKQRERERNREREKEEEERERERVLSSSRRVCGFERMGGPSCELERSASLSMCDASL